MASLDAAPFSFHCSICFDEFNTTTKPPVILPCGHTYLCEPCSKRLKSCMECRSPLFIAVPKTTGFSPSALRHNNPRRYSFSPSSSPSSEFSIKKTTPSSNASSPRQQQEFIQLPIPKNLVLIALLEAAQQTVKSTEKRQDEGYESGDDDEQVVAGMNLLSSDFGTYVVREKNGLVVQPLSPSPSCDHQEQVAAPAVDTAPRQFPELDVEVESIDLQDPVGVQALSSNPSSNPSSSLEGASIYDKNDTERRVFRENELDQEHDKDKPFMLQYGQTVQVVSFVDGVATLARSNGFIEASDRQLVKIGDAIDNACKIEGMLSAVASNKETMQRKLEEIDYVEGELHDKLDDALLEREPDPFARAPGFEDALASLSSSTPDSLSLNKSTGTSERSLRNHPDLTSGRTDISRTESAEFDNFVLSVTAPQREEEQLPRSLPPTTQVLSPEPAQSLPYFGCTGSIIPGFLSNEDDGNTSPLYDVRRPRNSVRFHGIDFRTGLSGHMALTSPSAHVERGQQQRHIRMMGEHRGIASVRHIKKDGSSGSLSNPTW